MSRFEGVENPGSYLSAYVRDFYEIENLIAYGARPASQVSSKTSGPAQRELPGPVEQHDWSVSLMDDSSESIPAVQHDPNRGAA